MRCTRMQAVTNKYKVIGHIFIAQWGEHLTVHEVDCLGEETVLVPGCPGIWGSVAPARQQKFKKGWLGFEGSRVIFLAFSSFWMYPVLEG